MDPHARWFFVGVTALAGLGAVAAFVWYAGFNWGPVLPGPVPTAVLSAPTRVGSPMSGPSAAVTEPILAPPEPSLSAEPSTTVSVLFVGDIMLDRNVRLRSLKAGSRAYPFEGLPAGWLGQDDYTVANLEGPVTDRRRPPDKSIDFQFEPDVIPALKATGIDAFSQANNHALDQGSEGYADSVRRLRDAGFLVFGHEVQDGDVSLATTTIKGISFAFLGFNTTDNPFDYASAERVMRDARAKARVVLVFMHWGEEYRDRPTKAQTALAHWLVDHGANTVIGGHPHWVQGLEVYAGAPIVYSLGNFVFDQDFSVETRQGMAVRLLIDRTGVTQVDPIPLWIDQSRPRVLAGEERSARLKRLTEISDGAIKDFPPLRQALEEGELSLRFSE